jgi:hypothetical protein
MGWLGNVYEVDYLHRLSAIREWSLGFGIIHVEPSGLSHLQPIRIARDTDGTYRAMSIALLQSRDE